MLRIFLVFFASLFFSVAFSQTTFQKFYGGPQEEYGYAFQNTSDGGSVVCGRTFSFGTGGWEGYVLRLNSSGDTLWTRTYGNVLYDEIQDVDTTSDGGFILTGHTTTFDWAGDLSLIKLDANGDIDWDLAYGGSTGLSDKGYSVRETDDGGFVTCGTTESFGQGGDDVYVVKTSSTGLVEWTRTIGTSGTIEAGREIQQTSDGGYIVAGYTDGSGTSFYDVFLVKLNSLGVVEWNKTYGGSSYDFAYTVQETTDNGFILGATTNSFGAGDWDAFLIKTDSGGNLQWSNAYGLNGEDRVQAAQQTSDGGYILCGRSSTFGAGDFDATLLKTNGSGVLQWAKAYGGTSEDQAWYVREIDGSGFLMCGYSFSFGAGSRDICMIRTDNSGNSGCNEQSGSLTSTNTTPSTAVGTLGISGNGGVSSAIPVAIRGTDTEILVECEEASVVTLTTEPFGPDSFCRGDFLEVDYSSDAVFNAGNTFIAELSDASGNFDNSVPIGFINSTSNAGTITCIIPDMPPGNGYRVRVVSTDPVLVGSDNGEDLEILNCDPESGCTDETACNYSPAATVDDGSCVYPGCNDPNACNYDPAAGCYDGSCDFLSCVGCTDPTADNYDPNATISCPTCCCYFDPSVLCGDGTFWSEELQECVVLCPGDLNFDGFVNTQDLLIFLSVFGLVCD